MRAYLPILLLSLVAGCATVSVAPPPASSERAGIKPSIGERSTAPVGGLVLSQYKYIASESITFSGGVAAPFYLGRVVAAQGDLLAPVTLNGRTVYCTQKLAYADPIAGPQSPACFIDANNDGAFETVTVRPGAFWFEQQLSPTVAYTRQERMVPRSGSYKSELLYQGTSRGSLRLAYREYIDDLARPAFSQDVTYDIAGSPTMITFRTVRIEVLSADNNQIEYRVVSGF